ncbi:MAG: threonine--tRNA ligase, partial [Thermoprotei archaeon]
MPKISIKLPSGEIIEGKAGERIVDVIPSRTGLVAKVGGKVVDLTSRIKEEWKVIEVLDFNSREGKETYWHTTAHVMAQAVKRLFPNAKLGIGPPIENGFYYDFDLGGYTFTEEDIAKIENEMSKIIKEDIPIERIEMSKEDAYQLFKKRGETYKLELLSEMPEETVTIYRQGEFVDLCRGPHLPST